MKSLGIRSQVNSTFHEGNKSNSSKLAKQTLPEGAGVTVMAGNANLGGYRAEVSRPYARRENIEGGYKG